VTGSRLTARFAAEKPLPVLASKQKREARQTRAQRGHVIAAIINEASQRRAQRLAVADQPVAKKREQLGQLAKERVTSRKPG
jgi:hypothetical protein